MAAQRKQYNAGVGGGIGQRGNARQGFEEMMPELRLGKLSRQESDKESTGIGRGILDKGIVS